MEKLTADDAIPIEIDFETTERIVVDETISYRGAPEWLVEVDIETTARPRKDPS